jgi:protein-disulfide isomerase
MRSSIATAVAAMLVAGSLAQVVPIPSKPDGFRYPLNSNATAPVQINAYFDLMCPDCLVSSLTRENPPKLPVQPGRTFVWSRVLDDGPILE